MGWKARSPMRDKEHLNMEGPLPARIDDPAIEQFEVDRDLSDIRQVDAVLMNLVGAERVSIGTMCELGFAYAVGKPVVAAQEPHDEIHDHLFVDQLSTVIVPSLGDAITVLRELGRVRREPAYA